MKVMWAARAGRLAAAVVCTGLVFGLSACGGGGPAGGDPATVVDTGTVNSLGSVLTTSSGMTLYMYPPDAERRVSCTGTCALDWPPLTTGAGTGPKAGPGVQQSLLSADPDPAGGRSVVTYDGWPLYTYREDISPGQATGQGTYLNGGYWYAIAPSGQPLTVIP